MIYLILTITACFGAGAIATVALNKGKDPSVKRARWIKYFSYLLIVYGIAGAIIAGGYYFPVVALIAGGTGYYEIVHNGTKHGSTRLVIYAVWIYSMVLAGFAGFVLFTPSFEILAFYLLVVMCDGFSQLCGQLWGKTKLAPEVSPNKTVEGFVLGSAITLLAMLPVLLKSSRSFHLALLICLGMCMLSLCGDLLASKYKRLLGIKDYSSLIPGHGGVLDRFDSFIAAGAAYYLYRAITGFGLF
jgi:phosphatidate cytidylyltransferase